MFCFKHIRNSSIYFASGHKPSPRPCYICIVSNDVKTAVKHSVNKNNLLYIQHINVTSFDTLYILAVYLPYTVILSFIAVDGSITNVLHKNISLYRMLCLREILSYRIFLLFEKHVNPIPLRC